jgi:pimeloyl-ACP methyl ester carboxylesterase
MNHTLRTRFKKEILAEFIPPKKPTRRVVIFCDGLPSVPSKAGVLEFFHRRGYWVFYFRYRGTWESGGMFLAGSPDRDVTDIIDQLPKGFTELWGGKRFKVKSPQVSVVGTSFGGCAAILASRDRRVKKAVALSPVVDWRIESKIEPIDFLAKFVEQAFGAVYRCLPEDWNKLKTGYFFNPVAHEDEIDGRKLMIIHAQDDLIVPWKPTAEFAGRVGARLIVVKKGGHLRLAASTRPPFANRVIRFLASRK